MKMNIIRALVSLFFTSMVITQLQASEPASSKPASSVVKSKATSSNVDCVAKMHIDQLALLKSLDFGARQIVDAVNGIESIKFTPCPVWVQYVPMQGPYGIYYVQNEHVPEKDPEISNLIGHHRSVMKHNFDSLDTQVTKKRPFLGHGERAIALFESAHNALNRALVDEDDESIAQAAQDYLSLIDLQKNFVENQQKITKEQTRLFASGIVQAMIQNAQLQGQKNQQKKIIQEQAKLIVPDIVQTIIQKAQVQAQANQDAAAKLARKEAKKAKLLAQKQKEKESLAQAQAQAFKLALAQDESLAQTERDEYKRARAAAKKERLKNLKQLTSDEKQEIKHDDAVAASSMDDNKNDSLVEQKQLSIACDEKKQSSQLGVAASSLDCASAPSNDITDFQSSYELQAKKIKALEEFLDRVVLLLDADSSLATFEKRWNLVHSEAISIFLNKDDYLKIYAKNIDPFKKLLNKVKTVKKHDPEHNKVLYDSSRQFIGLLGSVAEKKLISLYKKREKSLEKIKPDLNGAGFSASSVSSSIKSDKKNS